MKSKKVTSSYQYDDLPRSDSEKFRRFAKLEREKAFKAVDKNRKRRKVSNKSKKRNRGMK